MFKKSTLSNLEHKLLLIPTSIIPILFFVGVIISILQIFFPPTNSPQIIYADYGVPSFSFVIFAWSFFVSLCISFFALLFKRVNLCWFSLLIPIFAFVLLSIDIFSRAAHLSESAYIEIKENNFFFPFQASQIYLLGFIIFLFLWHTKILIQDKIRENLNSKLP